MAGALGAGSAMAQDTGASLNQSYWFQLGAFYPKIDSSIQADQSSTQLGTAINFENDLGLKDKKVLPTLLLGGRFGDRWRVEFETFSLKRTGSETLQTEIVFDDTTYPVAAIVASELNSKVYRLGIGYSFYRTPSSEAGVSLGVHMTDFKVGLAGVGIGVGSGSTFREEEKSKAVPLPTIGLYGTFAVAPSWILAGRADLFDIKAGSYKGSLVNLQANAIYRFTPNVGLGLGYRFDDYSVKANRSDWQGRFDYKFSGPQLFVDVGL